MREDCNDSLEDNLVLVDFLLEVQTWLELRGWSVAIAVWSIVGESLARRGAGSVTCVGTIIVAGVVGSRCIVGMSEQR